MGCNEVVVMRKVICWVLIFNSLLFFSQIRAKIIAVKDGDTVVALLENNQKETLRLAEVDCPENRQPFGKNAKQFTSSQVFGQSVVFYSVGKDRYRRTIAKIFYSNEKYLSAEIIKAGFGWWYYQASKDTRLKEYETRARKRKLGLWQDKNAVSPWEFRKAKKMQQKIKKAVEFKI